jgi:large subunit ribosomal protein L6
MTRKGKVPIEIPNGVEVKADQAKLSVKGPKGLLEQELMKGLVVRIEDSKIHVGLDDTAKEHRNMHGLYHALITNMVEGVKNGFQKQLEMIGVGYRAAVQGNLLNLQVGLSHPTNLDIPEGLTVSVEKNTKITISGADKQKIGQFASTIRSIRPPEPYQGKGIRYSGEYVRRKAGKGAAKK